jgi:hypothetical protein
MFETKNSAGILKNAKIYAAPAKPFGSVLLFSRQVFSAQDSARQKLKIRPKPSGNKLSESVLTNSVRCL